MEPCRLFNIFLTPLRILSSLSKKYNVEIKQDCQTTDQLNHNLNPFSSTMNCTSPSSSGASHLSCKESTVNKQPLLLVTRITSSSNYKYTSISAGSVTSGVLNNLRASYIRPVRATCQTLKETITSYHLVLPVWRYLIGLGLHEQKKDSSKNINKKRNKFWEAQCTLPSLWIAWTIFSIVPCSLSNFTALTGPIPVHTK